MERAIVAVKFTYVRNLATLRRGTKSGCVSIVVLVDAVDDELPATIIEVRAIFPALPTPLTARPIKICQ